MRARSLGLIRWLCRMSSRTWWERMKGMGISRARQLVGAGIVREGPEPLPPWGFQQSAGYPTRKNTPMKRLAALFLVLLSSLAFSAEVPPAARREIAHLMDYLAHSGCQFKRNGSWYGPAQAVDHINGKYAYLVQRGLV